MASKKQWLEENEKDLIIADDTNGCFTINSGTRVEFEKIEDNLEDCNVALLISFVNGEVMLDSIKGKALTQLKKYIKDYKQDGHTEFNLLEFLAIYTQNDPFYFGGAKLMLFSTDFGITPAKADELFVPKEELEEYKKAYTADE